MNTTCLAVDIGASSGRHILGSVQDGKISLEEIYRFENGVSEKNGHLCWNLSALKNAVVEGLKKAHEAGFAPKTMGIDTWAVDFVLLDENDQILGDSVAYRDERTDGICQELEEKGITSFQECYARTGIQYQKFNTIYQLMAVKRDHPEYLEKAKTFLMIPDYLNFVLTGVKANEYTNASTTGLLNAGTKDWDDDLIQTLGLPGNIFQKISMPGTVLGPLKKELQEETGCTDLQVILPATHDTGSAFLAVPAKDDHAVFLSSGTWSLLGVENPTAITTPESAAANFTNEGGYAYRFRYLKNIMGLWMFQNVRKELNASRSEKEKYSFQQLQEMAWDVECPALIDVDDNRFLAPACMIDEVKKAAKEKGVELKTDGEVISCIFHSLAYDYGKTVKELSALTKNTYTSLNIVGGGSRNAMLNQLTADYTGLPVYAGPTEGTALGNLIVQFLHAGYFKDLQEARDAIRTSFAIETYAVRNLHNL
jgi:rhamnulokinase